MKILKLLKNNKIKYSLIIFLVIAVSSLVLYHSVPKYVSKSDERLDTINRSIKNEVNGEKTDEDTRLKKLTPLLSERKDILKIEFSHDPSLVDKYKLDSDTLSKIPDSIENLIEKNKKISGSLSLDDVYGSRNESITNYELNYIESGKSQKTELFLRDKAYPAANLAEVKVDGIYLDGKILSSSENVEGLDNTPNASNDLAKKEDRALVFRIKFKDSNIDENSDSDNGAKSAISSVDSFYKKYSLNSYGLSYVGQTKWITLPYSKKDSCTENYQKWNDLAKSTIAHQAYPGYNIAIFQYFDIENPCMATPPGGGASFQVAGRGGGDRIMLFGRAGFGVIAHELGHVLGLNHASSDYDCDKNKNCTWDEYGNPYDIMGRGSGFSALNMLKLGWIGTDRVLSFAGAKKDDTYVIYSSNKDYNLTDKTKPLLICDLGAASTKKYCYEQVSGSLIGNMRLTNNGHLFLLDLALSSVGGVIELPSGLSAEIISINESDTTLKIIKSANPTIFNEIRINSPTHLSATDGSDVNFKIKAGEKIDLASMTEIMSLGGWTECSNCVWPEGVNSQGLFESTKAGIHAIKASANGVDSNIVKIEVIPLEASKISLSPNTSQKIVSGQPLQFYPSIQDRFGNNVVADKTSYSWSGTDTNGLFVSSRPGNYQVKVSGGGFESEAVDLEVTALPLDHIYVIPESDVTIKAGESINFVAHPKDKNNSTLDGASISWVGADIGGVFTSEKTGDYKVKATSNGVESKTVTVSVLPSGLSNLDITPAKTQTIKTGESIKFSAIGKDKFGNNITDLKLEWVGADQNGIYTPKMSGLYTVKVTSGSINSSSVNVVVSGDDIIEKVEAPTLMGLSKNNDTSDIPKADEVVKVDVDDKLKLTGSSIDGSDIEFYINNKLFKMQKIENKSWSLEIDTRNMKVGSYDIVAQAKKSGAKSRSVKLLSVYVSDKQKGSTGQSSSASETQDDPKTSEGSQADYNALNEPIFIGVATVLILFGVSSISVILLKVYFAK